MTQHVLCPSRGLSGPVGPPSATKNIHNITYAETQKFPQQRDRTFKTIATQGSQLRLRTGKRARDSRVLHETHTSISDCDFSRQQYNSYRAPTKPKHLQHHLPSNKQINAQTYGRIWVLSVSPLNPFILHKMPKSRLKYIGCS
jgi:hypothetical protein